MGQGENREEQTLLALNQLGGTLGFADKTDETMIFFEKSTQTTEEKKECIEKTRKGNKQWGNSRKGDSHE